MLACMTLRQLGVSTSAAGLACLGNDSGRDGRPYLRAGLMKYAGRSGCCVHTALAWRKMHVRRGRRRASLGQGLSISCCAPMAGFVTSAF